MKSYTLPLIFLGLMLVLVITPSFSSQAFADSGGVVSSVKINDLTTNGPILDDTDLFGSSVANIGDLDGDGIQDIAVGAWHDSNQIGTLHIVFLNTDGTPKSTVEINGSTPNGPALVVGDLFGWSVANIGDLDGDGIQDIAVGAPNDDSTGVTYIIFLNIDGTPKSTVAINSSTTNGPTFGVGDRFGNSIANIGDLDGDGVQDLVVGTIRDSTGGLQRGAVHIMFMNTDGTIDSTVEINDSTPNGPVLSDVDEFGSSVANIGDLDGDGINDLAVGAIFDDNVGTNSGAIHIIFLNTDGTPKSTVEINGFTPNGPVLMGTDYFGSSITSIGDLDDDGIQDLAVGAERDGIGSGRIGAVHIMFMNTDGTPKSTVEINDSTPNGPILSVGDTFGNSIANIGDLDGNGIEDLVVGAEGDGVAGSQRGAVHIIFLDGPEPSVIIGGQLFVSAENPQFSNYMSGSQVIEVVILDSTPNNTTIPIAEPEVTVNGDALRMLQAVDGNWYGYFADNPMAQIADSTAITENGIGLDYGDFCSANDATTILGIDLTETVGVAVSNTGEIAGLIGSSTGGNIVDNCIFTPGTPDNTMNVLRETKILNVQSQTGIGQLGLTDIDHWPFIQVYNLNPTGTVDVQYNEPGGAQTITLVFDTVEDFADTQLDRSSYPQNSQVHVTITDVWLNIDPTDEDSWTFGTYDTPSTNYQVFDENGLAVGDIPENTDDNLLVDFLFDLMCDDNCILLIDPNAQAVPLPPLTLSDNDDSEIIGTDPNDALSFQTVGGNLDGKIPVTITELSSNNGIFGTFDESDESVLKTTTNAMRGTSGTLDYNDAAVSIVIAYEFASIDMDQTAIGSEWTSGEEIPVILVDGDLNKNTKQDEDLNFYDPDVDLIPSLQMGTPFTLESLSSAQLSNSALTIQDVQKFSQRALLETPLITIQNGDSLQLSTSDTFGDLFNSINNPAGTFSGFNYFNYDIRSIEQSITGGSINSIDIDVTDGQNTARISSTSQANGLINLVDATGDDIFSMNPNSNVQIIFTFDVSGTPVISDQTVLPTAADFFSFGRINDGALPSERISNMLIRAELEETGDNTGIFEGTLQYVMLNQLNINNPQTYDGLDTISDDTSFIVPEGLLDEFSPRINHNDLAADGVPTQVSDQQEAPSHSGIVSFNLDSYQIGEQVDVTLVDSDLDLSANIIDIYTVVNPSSFPSDPARDTVGDDSLGLYTTVPFGEFGRLLDITFDGERWSSGETLNGGACGAPGTPDDGLFSTGFILVETGLDSGIFEGNFMVPTTYCNSASGLIETTSGKDIEVNYVDYTDAGNSIIEVGDSANIPSLFCDDMTIDELIASGNYNVIDNRDGHLNGSVIIGTNGDDLILASDAGNVIKAKKGNDCVIGGTGDDELRGGNGDDTIFGQDGNDLMIGGKLNDILYGGNGNDQIRGSANNDQLFGENGDDNLKGNSGDDVLSCGVGTDIANGGRGTDTATADCETIKGIP